jgi:hypothetical protein
MPDNWVDALFNRSLDVFGKIGPGLVLLAALFVSLEGQQGVCRFISDLQLGAWVAVFAAAWVTGIAVQSLGEFLCLISYWPERKICETQWRTMTTEFRSRKDYQRHKDGYYRLGVIKEACGNTYVALIATAILLLIVGIFDGYFLNIAITKIIITSVFYIAIVLLLWRMHCKHVERQNNYLAAVLDRPDWPDSHPIPPERA